MKYQKSWISINEQIALLTENKGLKCSNQSELERALVEVGYYKAKYSSVTPRTRPQAAAATPCDQARRHIR